MSTPTRYHRLSPASGDGHLAILAHGLEDSWESWLPLAGELGPGWDIVALDLPWRPGNDYRWRGRPAADLLGEAVAAVGARPDLVVAHSYCATALLDLLGGGTVAPRSGAVLICPLYRPTDVAVTWRVFDKSRRAFERHIRDSLLARLPSGPRIPDDVLATMIAKTLDRIGPTGFLTVFEQFVSSTHVAVEQVAAPVLVVAGGDDPTLSPRAGEALVRRLPRGQLLIDGSHDHFCHIKRPAEIADALIQFAGAPLPEPSTGRHR